MFQLIIKKRALVIILKLEPLKGSDVLVSGKQKSSTTIKYEIMIGSSQKDCDIISDGCG